MKGFDIRRKFYAMSSADGDSAEIQMYGDVVETWPVDWWTGERKEGSYIAQDEFLRDLQTVEGCSNVTIRMNSYGGDAVVGIVIHNRLRELAANGTHLTCVVDGVAMSAGSVIMCACDTVRVNPSSLVMIHNGWLFLYGGYNADDLRKTAESMDSYDRAMVSVYKRKSGLSETVISHMMKDETYMTGKEAVEKGFANELIEDAEPLSIAASADGRSLYVRGREMHLCPGMVLPDNIPTFTPGANAPDAINENQPVVVAGGEEGGNSMTKDELREQYPELIAEVEADARAAVDTNAAVTEAVQAEERRIREIDEVAALFSDELVQEAKYGDNRCSAQELAYRAAQNAARQGSRFLADADADAEDSGAEEVPAAPGETDEDEESTEKIEAQAKAAVAAFLKRKEDK